MTQAVRLWCDKYNGVSTAPLEPWTQCHTPYVAVRRTLHGDCQVHGVFYNVWKNSVPLTCCNKNLTRRKQGEIIRKAQNERSNLKAKFLEENSKDKDSIHFGNIFIQQGLKNYWENRRDAHWCWAPFVMSHEIYSTCCKTWRNKCHTMGERQFNICSIIHNHISLLLALYIWQVFISFFCT